MPKKQINLSEIVMSKIKKENIQMKPKWYFVAGSLALVIGISSSLIISSYLISLVTFSLRTHGPMKEVRFSQLISSFPWWAPIISILGIAAGILFLRRFDFSYKKNFIFLMLLTVFSVIIGGYLIDRLGIGDYLSQGPMKRFYQKYDGGVGRGKWLYQNDLPNSRGQGRSRMRNQLPQDPDNY